MSFVSNVYIIKTLSTAKALTLQEGQVYRDVSEMDIYSDTYFTACFGEGAFILCPVQYMADILTRIRTIQLKAVIKCSCTVRKQATENKR